ncbi:unnamed protein product [Prunus brigantina]
MDNKKLGFDCRSEDNVIDRSLPARGDEFEFGFCVNFQFTTYFFCNLWYLDWTTMLLFIGLKSINGF